MRRYRAVRIAGDYWELRQCIEEDRRQGVQVKPATLARLGHLQEQLRQFLVGRFKQEDRLGDCLVRLSANGQGETVEVTPVR